jgi:hypothetical protein
MKYLRLVADGIVFSIGFHLDMEQGVWVCDFAAAKLIPSLQWLDF